MLNSTSKLPDARSQLRDEPALHLLPSPWSLPQKRECRLHRGIELEAADRDASSHLAPTMTLHELIEDAFQRDAVQRIARMIDGF